MKWLQFAVVGALLSVAAHASNQGDSCAYDKSYPGSCSYPNASFGEAMHALGLDARRWEYQNDTAAVSKANPNSMTIGVTLPDGTVQYTDFAATNTVTRMSWTGTREGANDIEQTVETMVNGVYVRFTRETDYFTGRVPSPGVAFRVCITPSKDQVGVCQMQE
jgi:hypothetical protein